MATKKSYSKKSRLATLLLCIFLGSLGVHRFYAGKVASGIIILLFTLSMVGLFVSAIWTLIDLIFISSGEFKDVESKVIKNW